MGHRIDAAANRANVYRELASGHRSPVIRLPEFASHDIHTS